MRKLPRPTDRVKDVFELCIGSQILAEPQAILQGLQPTVETAEAIYDAAGVAGELYLLLPTENQHLELAVNIYDQRFRRKESPGRVVYDSLLVSSGRRCPLCGGVGFVGSLDHYLPKHPFWELAVLPINLVPACDHCNGAKHISRPATAEQQFIHPYYDDFDDEIWLVAEVTETDPVSVIFDVAQVATWDDTRNARVKYHFDELELAILFTSQAATELTDWKALYIDRHAQSAANGVHSFVVEQLYWAEQRPFRNDWKNALYRALCQSEWFREVGCLQIG